VSVRRLEAGESVSYGAEWVAPATTTVATLGIGYADGVPRSLQGRGQVLLNGRRRPIVGRVTMDFIMVDAGSDAEAEPGAVATLIGSDGGEQITVDEVAGWAGTVSYEILTRLGPRLDRRYTDSGS
jgi:alanine racemase